MILVWQLHITLSSHNGRDVADVFDAFLCARDFIWCRYSTSHPRKLSVRVFLTQACSMVMITYTESHSNIAKFHSSPSISRTRICSTTIKIPLASVPRLTSIISHPIFSIHPTRQTTNALPLSPTSQPPHPKLTDVVATRLYCSHRIHY